MKFIDLLLVRYKKIKFNSYEIFLHIKFILIIFKKLMIFILFKNF